MFRDQLLTCFDLSRQMEGFQILSYLPYLPGVEFRESLYKEAQLKIVTGETFSLFHSLAHSNRVGTASAAVQLQHKTCCE